MHKFQFSAGHAFLPHLRENFGREDGKIVDVLLEKFYSNAIYTQISTFSSEIRYTPDDSKNAS